LPAQPVKIEFLRENIEKSRRFGGEKTKLDARSGAIRVEFCFFTAQNETFRDISSKNEIFTRQSQQ
jgi:hypothetical protein